MKIILDDTNHIVGIIDFTLQTEFDENTIEVESVPDEVRDNCQYYKYEDGEFILDEAKSLEDNQIQNLLDELEEIKEWMNNTDYMVLKVIRGNWLEDDERYIQYLADYEIKYNRKNEIEETLSH